MKNDIITKTRIDRTSPTNYQQMPMPDVEDCYTDALPKTYVQANGKRKVLVPELTSMTKYLFDASLGNQRLVLYSYLNKLLRLDRLSRIVGFKVYNKVINKDVCSFPGVTYWKIDRENFYADVEVRLILQTNSDIRIWNGILECWCSFESEFSCSIEDLTDNTNRREQGFEALNPFLIPYYTNNRIDTIG